MAFDRLPRQLRSALYPTSALSVSARTVQPSTGRPRQIEAAPIKQPPAGKWQQRVPGKSAIMSVALSLVLGGAFFLYEVNRYSPTQGSSTALTLRWPGSDSASSGVDPLAIAHDLDRYNGRDDVTCHTTASAPAQLSCQAADGLTWAVTVTAPPDQFTARIVAPSVYQQTANHDIRLVVSGIEQCRKMTGELPQSATIQSVHGEIPCGNGIMTIYLQSGDTMEYQRIGAAYTVYVTASDGEMAQYDSKTRRYVP